VKARVGRERSEGVLEKGQNLMGGRRGKKKEPEKK